MTNSNLKNVTHFDESPLPIGWEYKPLSKICDIVSGGTPDRSRPEYWEGGDIPWATPTDITSDNKRTIKKTKEYITEDGLKSSSAKLVPAGSLLMTSRATIGEIKINEIEMCTNQGFKTLVPNELVNNKFLFYQMKFLKEKYEALGSGSTFLEVNKKDTDRFSIPMPIVINEQNKISDMLLTVDNAIEITEQLIDKYRNIKAGLMQDLFLRGIQSDGNLRPSYDEAPELYKPTELGYLPKDWDDDLLKNLTEKIIDGTHITPTYTESGIPFLRVTDIQERFINHDNLKYISNKEHNELTKRCKPEYGDILYSKNGTIGIPKVVDWKWEFSIFVSLALIKPKKNTAYNIYLYYLLQSFLISKQIIKRAKQGTVTNLHLEEIREFIIPLPKYEEQTSIANALSSIDSKIYKEEDFLNKLQTLKMGLMQDLLTGKVRVQVEGGWR